MTKKKSEQSGFKGQKSFSRVRCSGSTLFIDFYYTTPKSEGLPANNQLFWERSLPRWGRFMLVLSMPRKKWARPKFTGNRINCMYWWSSSRTSGSLWQTQDFRYPSCAPITWKIKVKNCEAHECMRGGLTPMTVVHGWRDCFPEDSLTYLSPTT